MADRTNRTTNKKAKFLERLRLGHSVAASAKSARMGRQTAYDWRKEDPDFAAAWDDAYECGSDWYEDKLRSKAAAGDTACIIFALKSRRPDQYRERIQHDNYNRELPVSKEQVRDGLRSLGTKDYDELRAEIATAGPASTDA